MTCTKERCSQMTRDYIKRLKALGCKKIGVYMNNDYYNNYYDDDLKDNKTYKLWLADYTGDADHDCALQQYSSNGVVSGIDGKVDMNYLFDETMLSVNDDTQKENANMGTTAQKILDIMEGKYL